MAEQSLMASIKAFVLRQYLPLAFLVAFIVAMAWPAPGQAVLAPAVMGVHIITFINICTVFFISGLTLRTDELKAAFRRTAATGTVFGMLSIIGITPLLGFAVRLLPLQPAEYVAGLTIFTIVPTTLGVGVSLAQSAKGNVGLAIFLTVASNVVGIIFVPLWLKVMLSAGGAGIEHLSINIADIFVKLLLSNFVPTVAGKLLRDCVPAVGAWVKRNRTPLSLINNSSLAFIIWQTLSSARDLIVNSTFGTMLLVFIAALLIHVGYLVFNTVVVKVLRVPVPEAVSTIIMASQKSAPVAVTAISYITPNPVTQGLLSVPAITGQLLQIFIGQPLAHFMATKVDAWHEQQKTKELLPVVAASQDVVVDAGVVVDPSADSNSVSRTAPAKDVAVGVGARGVGGGKE